MNEHKIINIPKRREVSVSINVTENKIVRRLIDTIEELTKDERIDEKTRNEYADKIASIIKKDR